MSETKTAPRTRNRRAKMDIDASAQTVTFRPFVPGTDQPTGEVFVAEYAPLPDAIKLQLGLDRLRNKLMDSYSDPADDVMASLRTTYDALLGGQWAIKGETGERTTLFIEAYAELKQKPLEDVRRRVYEIEAGDDAKAKANLAGWRKAPEFVARMAKIAERKARERSKAAAEAAKGAPQVELEEI